MTETKTLSMQEAMEITQEIPEIFAQLIELEEAGVEFVELGVEGDQIVIREVEKSNPTSSAVHVPSVNWNKDELLVSKAIEEEKRYTLSPWYIPDSLDGHDEWTDKEEIQRAFWEYLKNPDRTIKLQHNMDIIAGEWVEGLTWPHEVTVPIKHPEGNREITFPSGTPFLGVIWEPWAWELVKDGEILGLSIGGRGQRVEADMEEYDYDPMGKVSFTKTIRTVGGKYVVYSEDGSRKFGTYDTKAEAEERLRQIERFSKGDQTIPSFTLDIIKTFIDSIMKHGNHDQSSHGRGRGVLTDTPELDYDQQMALDAYMIDSYIDVNSGLRGLPLESMDDFEFEMNVNLLDSVMENSKLAHTTTLYRVIDADDVPSVLNIGETFEDKGFISTSKTGVIPEQVYEWHDLPVILKITAPKGTKAIDLDVANPVATKLGEILLNRGTKFRITNLDNYTPYADEPTIEVEVVP